MTTVTDRPTPITQAARRALWGARRDCCAPLLARARRLLTRSELANATGLQMWYALAGVFALDPGSPRQIEAVRNRLAEDIADYLVPRPTDQGPREIGEPTRRVLELLNECVQAWEDWQ